VIDVYVSPHRAAEDAKAFFRRSITSTGVRLRRVTTDKATCYPPALAEVLSLRPMRNFKAEPTAQVVCEGTAACATWPAATTGWE
jgi:transposase-like protein